MAGYVSEKAGLVSLYYLTHPLNAVLSIPAIQAKFANLQNKTLNKGQGKLKSPSLSIIYAIVHNKSYNFGALNDYSTSTGCY
jgi:hypothetical protein